MLPLTYRTKYIRNEKEVKIINDYLTIFKESINKTRDIPETLHILNHAYVFVPKPCHYYVLTKVNTFSGVYFDLITIYYPWHPLEAFCPECRYFRENQQQIESFICSNMSKMMDKQGNIVPRH